MLTNLGRKEEMKVGGTMLERDVVASDADKRRISCRVWITYFLLQANTKAKDIS